MNETRIRETPRHCCGAGVPWSWVLWIVVGLLALAALSVLPAALSKTLSDAGVL